MALTSSETLGNNNYATDLSGRIVTVGPSGGPIQVQVGTGGASTATLTNVSSSATNVTVLAANTSREGATVFNDSTQILYLKMGATASTTSHTVQIPAGGYYEVPYGYTGKLDGLWASANGSARVTELTA